MKQYQHILLATDFSESAQRATETALRLAPRFGAKVTIVHVMVPTPPPMTTPFVPFGTTKGELEAELSHIARRQLAATRAMFAEQTPVSVREVVDGDVPGGICQVAREDGCDLIIIGTHGNTGITRLVLGSVAEKVVRNAHCSVLTVNPQSEVDDIASCRILVATDLTPDASPALDEAIVWAKNAGAAITLMHVVHPGRPAWVGPPGTPTAQASLLHRKRLVDDATDRLSTMAAAPRAAGIVTNTETIADAQTADAICDRARGTEVDLVAVSTMGRSGIEHLVLGSVAERVVRQCTKPVLVARAS